MPLHSRISTLAYMDEEYFLRVTLNLKNPESQYLRLAKGLDVLPTAIQCSPPTPSPEPPGDHAAPRRSWSFSPRAAPQETLPWASTLSPWVSELRLASPIQAGTERVSSLSQGLAPHRCLLNSFKFLIGSIFVLSLGPSLICPRTFGGNFPGEEGLVEFLAEIQIRFEHSRFSFLEREGWYNKICC